MVKIKVNEQEYKVPDFISIDNYVKIFKQKDLFSEDYFAAKIINKLTDCPIEDLLEGDAEEMNYVAAYIMSLIPTESPKFVDRFELDGISYGFFPKWRDLSYAEFVDMDTISTKKPEELLNLLHILASIMYRPIVHERSKHDFDIEKYNIDSMKERAEMFKKKLDIKYVLGAQFFFINYAKTFLSYTQMSLMKNLPMWTKIKLAWKLRKMIMSIVFKKRSVGSLSQTELLEMIIQSTITSTKKSWWKF
jgi:hypothetical protein